MTWARGVSPWVLAAATASLLGAPGCRAPRDPDLDRRVEAARRGEGGTESPKPKRSRKKGGQEEDEDEPVLRTWSEAEVREAMAAVPGEGPILRATFHTDLGDVSCRLAPEAAPQTVANFVGLALGLRKWKDPDTGEESATRFYDGLTFHRAIAGFIAQTGRAGVAASGPGWRLPREPGLVSPDPWAEPGALAAVDDGGHTHGSQVFVSLRASPSLVGRYTVFGRCDRGLDVATAIAAGEKHPSEREGKSPSRPKDPVRIRKVEVVRAAD